MYQYYHGQFTLLNFLKLGYCVCSGEIQKQEIGETQWMVFALHFKPWVLGIEKDVEFIYFYYFKFKI